MAPDTNSPPSSDLSASHNGAQDIKLPMALMVLTSAIGPFAMISIVPLIPKIGDSFAVSYGTAQLSLSVYFAFFAIAQLILGPVSDRVGRKPVMVSTILLFALGSLLCAASDIFSLMLLGRGMQACGAAAGVIVTRAIMFDVYGREKSASRIGYLTMGMVLGPMAAPTVAGIFATTIGWQYMFWMLMVVSGATGVWLLLHLPETRWYGQNAATKSQGFFDGLPLLKNPVFLSYAGNWAFSSCVYYSFLAGAAFIVIEGMGRSEAEYGLYFSFCALCFMLGSFISARFATQLGLLRLIRTGSSIVLLAVGLQWVFKGTGNPFFIFLPMMMIALSHGILMPNAAASVMGVVPRLAGAASGLAGFMQIALGAVVTLLVGYLQHQYDYAMMVIMSVCAVIAISFLIFGRFKN